MTAKVFVDSNLLIYSRDSGTPSKQRQSLDWMQFLWKSRAGRLSTQVLNEFYVNVTQKIKPGLSVEKARQEIRDLFAWRPVPVNQIALQEAWRLQDQFHLSFWDSLILATAELQECKFLLSEDFTDGRSFHGIKVINPFRHNPVRLELNS